MKEKFGGEIGLETLCVTSKREKNFLSKNRILLLVAGFYVFMFQYFKCGLETSASYLGTLNMNDKIPGIPSEL